MPIQTVTNDQDTKTRIFLAAAELFSTLGYNGVSIRQICAKVGVGKPTLYYYFHDKETLLQELLQFAFAALRELTESQIAIQHNFYDRLYGLIKLRQQFARRFPYFIRFFVNINILSLPQNTKHLMLDHLNWVHQQMIRFIEDGKKEGIVKPDIPSSLLVHTIMGSLNQLTFRNIYTNNSELISDKDAKSIFQFWKQYLFKTENSGGRDE